jgi:hypothetical protein
MMDWGKLLIVSGGERLEGLAGFDKKLRESDGRLKKLEVIEA